jgi:hypothetical protein
VCDLAKIGDDVSISDAAQKLADSAQTRSQAAFAKIEKITNVNPTDMKQIMSAREDAIAQANAEGNLEKAGELEQLQRADADKMEAAFKQAKAADPTADVDRARSDWNTSLRADELSRAIRASKSNTSTLKNPVLDANKLAPRLQKMAEGQPGGKTSQLSQLSGDDDATALVEHAENARAAAQEIKDFVPSTATGKNALQDILTKNTEGKAGLSSLGKVVGKTNWSGAVKDFENLGAEGQAKAFGQDAAKVRQFLGRQALKQNAIDIILGKTTAGHLIRGAVAEEAIRRNL